MMTHYVTSRVSRSLPPDLVEIILSSGLDGLWSHVVESATTNVSFYTCVLSLYLGRYSKINQVKVASLADKVLWL